jgi:hypothetical protein
MPVLTLAFQLLGLFQAHPFGKVSFARTSSEILVSAMSDTRMIQMRPGSGEAFVTY